MLLAKELIGANIKLPGFRRIFKSDYDKEDQDLVESLSVPINNGIEVLYEALNNKLTFEDNFQSTNVNIQITVDSNGIPQGNTSFKLINTNRINGLQVRRAENLTNSNTYPVSQPFITFTQSGSTIILNHISGLQAGNQYLLNILAT